MKENETIFLKGKVTKYFIFMDEKGHGRKQNCFFGEELPWPFI